MPPPPPLTHLIFDPSPQSTFRSASNPAHSDLVLSELDPELYHVTSLRHAWLMVTWRSNGAFTVPSTL